MHPSQGLWFPGVMAVAWLLSPARGVWGCGWGSSLKNGVFLNVPFSREAANAAELLALAASPLRLVRHAARDGSLPAEQNIKKHHRFF